jgi:hypothetical protein
LAGMNIKYTEQQAEISMKCYLEEAIEESKMDITGTVNTPATRTLFEVDDASPLLNKDDAEIFHSVVAKLLYVATRARMDIGWFFMLKGFQEHRARQTKAGTFTTVHQRYPRAEVHLRSGQHEEVKNIH